MSKKDIIMGPARIYVGGTVPTAPSGLTPLTVDGSGVPSTGGTDIGLTSEGLKFTYEPTVYNIMSQQSMAPVDVRVTEEKVMLEFSALEVVFEKLQNFLLGSQVVLDNTSTPKTETVSGGGYGFIDTNVVTAVAQQVDSSGTVLYHAICLYDAFMDGPFEITYDRKKETIVPIKLMGLADTTRDVKDQLYQIYRQKPATP